MDILKIGILNYIKQTLKDKIYYETKNGILLKGDCLEIIKLLPDNSIDLVLTDPPYNIADNSKITKVSNKIKSNKEAWGNAFKDKWDCFDDYVNWILFLFENIKSKLNDTGSLISFFDRKYTGYFIYLLEQKGYVFKNKIYFEKNNPIPHIRKNNYRSCIEEAIWLIKNKKYKINFLSQKEMKQIFKGNIGKKETKHPTEKYIWMIKPLIIRHSNENDIVLDPFIGSGTTAVVCEQLNRKWIGIEIEEKYCKICKERLKNMNMKNKLF